MTTVEKFHDLTSEYVIAIYDLLMRPRFLSEGLRKQTWVDHWHEFAWSISVKQSLASLQLRHVYSRVVQSTSRQNHRVERQWPKVNRHIDYTIKSVLVEMEASGEVDMSNEITKFCFYCVSDGYIKSN